MPNVRGIWNVGIFISSFQVLQLNVCEYFRKIYNKTVISSWLTSKQHPLLLWNTSCDHKTGSLAWTHGREGTLKNLHSSRVCHGPTRRSSCRRKIGYFYLLLISCSFFFFHSKVSLGILIRSSCLLLFSSNVHPSLSCPHPKHFFLQRITRPKFLFFVVCIYRRKMGTFSTVSLIIISLYGLGNLRSFLPDSVRNVF